MESNYVSQEEQERQFFLAIATYLDIGRCCHFAEARQVPHRETTKTAQVECI